ncbi:MAG: phosphoribosylanthranilate isomerase [Trichlorobacter sp.]|nr:phosphoribosylanthranilate isomerase [Trichlorobacter sp.]
MIRIKICGITNPEDALAAVKAGADALGFVFYNKSPRYVTPQAAEKIISLLPPFVQPVGLFVNEDADIVNKTAACCRLGLVQLHGDETPDYFRLIRQRTIKALRVKNTHCLDTLPAWQAAGYLLDTYSPDCYGGSGTSFNWQIAREAAKRHQNIILAGGLTPENVASAIEQAKPYAVDVSSGVESAPGKKDFLKMQTFIEAARATKC